MGHCDGSDDDISDGVRIGAICPWMRCATTGRHGGDPVRSGIAEERLRPYSQHSPAMQHEFLTIEDRASDSTFVERIWTARSLRAGEFLSVVAGHWEMVVPAFTGGPSSPSAGPKPGQRPSIVPAMATGWGSASSWEPSGRRFFRVRFAIGVMSRWLKPPRDRSG